MYDVKKLNWVNSHYIKKLNLDELIKITLPPLKEKYDLSDKSEKWIKHLDWLDNYLPVKTIKIVKAEEWLKTI